MKQKKLLSFLFVIVVLTAFAISYEVQRTPGVFLFSNIEALAQSETGGGNECYMEMQYGITIYAIICDPRTGADGSIYMCTNPYATKVNVKRYCYK